PFSRNAALADRSADQMSAGHMGGKPSFQSIGHGIIVALNRSEPATWVTSGGPCACGNPRSWESSMNRPRRRFLQLAGSACALPALGRVAYAQTYPSRSLLLLVGYAAGGVNDIVARLTGQIISERLGQPVTVENRAGAGSNLATEAVVRASPDGYTLLEASTS